MAQIYRDGEIKIRPDVYYRYSNKGTTNVVATDGINAIVMKASWGPAGAVKEFNSFKDLKEAYGDCDGVKMAEKMFAEGVTKIYVYRATGESGKKATGTVGTMTVTAKYEGVRPVKIKIQAKPGDAETMQLFVIVDNVVKEQYEFADGASSSNDFAAQLNRSEYVSVEAASEPEQVTANEVELSSGADPTVNTEGYAAGYAALEPYYYNVICQDAVDEDTQAMLTEYIKTAVEIGKFPFAVVSTTKSLFTDKLDESKAFNDANVVYVGNTYIDTDGAEVSKQIAVASVAGVISATPSSKSVVHKVINGAVDIPEKLTNSQYEQAIESGMVLFSVSSDGQVWLDSGVTTLVTPGEDQDNGWKKIKRTKVRGELMHRLNTLMEKKVGRVNCDADGIADVIQTGSGLLNDMAYEKKILTGGKFYLDTENPQTSDSAWFIVEADDIDTLEKIYLHYKFSVQPTA